MPPKWGFSPICDPPRIFFKNRALSLLYPYGALTSCKKLEKSLEQSLRYLKTDGLRTTDGPRTWVITQDPSRVNPGSKINVQGKVGYRESTKIDKRKDIVCLLGMFYSNKTLKLNRDIRRRKREKRLMKQKYQHQRIFGPSLTKTEVQLKRNMQQTRTIQLSLINYYISISDVRKDKSKNTL